MKLFTDIAPIDGDATILRAVRAITSQLDQLPTPRSLCEMGMDEEDYQWLCAWAHNLTRHTVQWWLYPLWAAGSIVSSSSDISRFEGGGCLFLLLSAEVARREAREGFVWPAVQDKYAPDTRQSLFVQGQPIQQHKDAMEAAARKLHLRHVFGIAGTQNYYVSVYLQFGFTQKGIPRLPFWLAGQAQTEAAAYLLGTDQGSKTFAHLWQTLRDYRRGNVPEAHVRQVIQTSAWVLPQWCDDLVRQAREKLELGTATAIRVEPDDDQSLPFLEPPRLRWDPPSSPQFITRLVNLAALELEAQRYDVLIDDDEAPVARLLRQPDGTYTIPDVLILSCDTAQPVITLVDQDGQLHRSQQIELWDLHEDVVAWEYTSGRHIAAWQDRMLPTKRYVLLTASDLAVRPEPAIWQVIAKGASRLSLLQADWLPQLHVLLDDQVLWTPHLGPGSRAPVQEPEWAQRVRLYLNATLPISLGRNLAVIVVGLSNNISLNFVRLGTQPLDFSRTDNTAEVRPFEVTPDIASSKLAFTLGLQHDDESAVVYRTVDADMIGAAQLTPSGWKILFTEQSLTLQEAARTLYRLFVPHQYVGERIRELALVEGSTFSRELSQRPRPLGRLGGFGARVSVQIGAYNSTETLFTLANKVENPGIVQTLEPTSGDYFYILLNQHLEPGPGHRIVFWPLDRGPTIIPLEQITTITPENDIWRINGDIRNPTRLIAGIAYEGDRLGAWWPEHIESVLNLSQGHVPSSDSLETTAALIRWMYLPILSHGYITAIRAFVQQYPAETMAAWLLDHGLPDGLHFDVTGEEWLSTLRCVFEGWRPTSDHALAIIETLSRDTSDLDRPLLATIPRLMRIDPLLMGRVVRTWLDDTLVGEADKIEAVKTINVLRRRVTDLSDTAPESSLLQAQKNSLNKASEETKVDANFLERGIVERALHTLKGATLKAIDAANLNAALASAPFRNYLGVRVLGEIIK